MRIGLRVFWNSSWMGGVHYVLGWARILRQLPEDESPEVFLLCENDEAFTVAQGAAKWVDGVHPFSDAENLQLDLVYPATQLAEVPFNTPWAGWIPDWQCRHLPHLFTTSELNRRKIQYGLLARHSSVCVCSSQQAIDDTEKEVPQGRRPLVKLPFPANLDKDVFSNAEELERVARAEFSPPQDYVIVCNQFWQHKNHKLILQAIQLAGDQAPFVVFTGELDDTRTEAYQAEILDLLSRAEIAHKVLVTGRVDRREQLGLMLGAKAFVQPSLFEGWSSFVEEGRALGKPMLLSDIPVHREQNPPNSVFFDPNDPRSLAAGFAEIATAKPTNLQDAQQHHQQFSMQCAKRFMDLACAVRSEWNLRHEAKTVTSLALDEITDKDDCSFEQSDIDRFTAGIRQLFQPSSLELARLTQLVCHPDHAFAGNAERQLVVSTLAKMPAEQVAAFARYDPDKDPWVEAMTDAQQNVVFGSSLRLASKSLYVKVREFAQRKLGV